MKIPFYSGPLDGKSVEIGNNLLEMVDVYEPTDGSDPVPFEIISPNNGLWTYTLARQTNGDPLYVGAKQPGLGSGKTLAPEAWTHVGDNFEVYNPTTEEVDVVASRDAVILPEGAGYRVRIKQ